MLDCPVAWSDSPVVFGLSTTVQVYVVPTGTTSEPPFAGVTVNDDPLQADAFLLAITGTGLTVTTDVAVFVQPVVVFVPVTI